MRTSALELDEKIERRLDLQPRQFLRNTTYEKAAQIEKEKIPLPWYWAVSQEILSMVDRKDESPGSMEPVLGRVFRTGIGDGVGRLGLLAAQSDLYVRSTPLSEVVHGTPAMIMIQSPEMIRSWSKMQPKDKDTAWQEALSDADESVTKGCGRMSISWGGWGSGLGEYRRRHALLQSVPGTDELSPYVLSANFGLLGSQHTLKPEIMPQLHSLGIRLGDFVVQLESALQGVARMIANDTDPGLWYGDREKMLLTGHSMGAYTLLRALVDPNPDLKVIKQLRGQKGTVFVADKPLIIGRRYKGDIPEWAEKYFKSYYYKQQVSLQDGLRGSIVRAGAHQAWDDLHLGKLRSLAGPHLSGSLFNYFITPKKVWNGREIYQWHLHNYFDDRRYHELCIRLLDGAEPVMGSRTVARVQGKVDSLRLLMSSGDKILKDVIAAVLGVHLSLRADQVKWGIGEGQSGHHPSLSELSWMYDLPE